MRRNVKLYSPLRQRGVVLVVALMVLLIITMIGVTSIQTTSLQQRMSTNLRDASLALQTADTGLRVAEAVIAGLATTGGFSTSGPYYISGNAPNPLIAATWTGSGVATATGSYGSAIAPQYFIELVGNSALSGGTATSISGYGQSSGTTTVVFRIVARSTGATGASQVILEEFYGRNF